MELIRIRLTQIRSNKKPKIKTGEKNGSNWVNGRDRIRQKHQLERFDQMRYQKRLSMQNQ